MRIAIIRLLGLALCCAYLISAAGCVSVRPDDERTMLSFASKEARNRQLGLTTLMAIDTAQTVTIARSPDCLYEANPLAAAVFGSDTPSPQRVLVTNTLYIGLHWILASYLDRKANAPIDLSLTAEQDMARRKGWRAAQTTYQVLTAVGHGGAVWNNQAQGIKPFSHYECAR